jgi:hypothetical protein
MTMMMMTILRRFRCDESGASHAALAVTAAAITVACLLGAHFLDRLSRPGGMPKIAIISSDGSAVSFGGRLAALPGRQPDATDGRFGDIDYTATGSLPKNPSRPVVLDPCTGEQK